MVQLFLECKSEGSVLIQFTMFMNDLLTKMLKKLITDLSEDNEITSS